MKNEISIDNLVRALLLDGQAALDDERAREDLMGLFMDIRSELQALAPEEEKQIYAYAALLQDEIELYSPHKAYEAGAMQGCGVGESTGENGQAFLRYVQIIENDPASKALHNEVSNMFNGLCNLLGDARGLIDEFTGLYRKCNGIVHSKIEMFFDMGFSLSHLG